MAAQFMLIGTKAFTLEGTLIAQGKEYSGRPLVELIINKEVPTIDPKNYPNDKEGPYTLTFFKGQTKLTSRMYGALRPLISDFHSTPGELWLEEG